MDIILLHYEDDKQKYSDPASDDPRMLHSIDMGWFLIDKYYQMSDEAPVYATAVILDPSKRAAYIKQNWPAQWHEQCFKQGQAMFKESYSSSGLSQPPQPIEQTLRGMRRPADPFHRLKSRLKVPIASTTAVDDFNAFVSSEPTSPEGLTPLEWWCKPEQRQKFPRLSRMAITILSIPAESAETERAFSGARRTCSWDRLSLRCSSIEKIECIGSWMREGHIRPGHMAVSILEDLDESDASQEDSGPSIEDLLY